ncbi:unnamed protein product [Pleuronectes platessa]|uniref:Uncharacterized protein n=1 Tax=Pleuronectes platessa TaxID=8262 RepID=A0A9N7Z4F9_PLEPL|nr:unnamed protein product [Pleuronectes platessa]
MAMTPEQLTWRFVIFKDVHWEFEEIGQLVAILHSLISNGGEMMDTIEHNPSPVPSLPAYSSQRCSGDGEIRAAQTSFCMAASFSCLLGDGQALPGRLPWDPLLLNRIHSAVDGEAAGSHASCLIWLLSVRRC